MSKKTNEKIINDFKANWNPQTISTAETIADRFIAGDSVQRLSKDYSLTYIRIENAIRFFLVAMKRSRVAQKLYDDWQQERFSEGKRRKI